MKEVKYVLITFFNFKKYENVINKLVLLQKDEDVSVVVSDNQEELVDILTSHLY